MLQFLREAIRDFRTTGAVLPSSPVLARVMTRSFAAAPSPRRILEVGEGVGAWLAVEPAFEGLVEAFDFALGLRVVR